jgi:hypothetical protein
MNSQVNKTLEHSFELAIALSATLLQIQFQFDIEALYLKLAIFSGSATYVFKAMRDENLSTKDALFTALSGYTLAVYVAPAICLYWQIKEPIFVSAIHYATGALGMLLLNLGWAIMKGAAKDGWPLIKSFITKWTNKDGSNQP